MGKFNIIIETIKIILELFKFVFAISPNKENVIHVSKPYQTLQ